MTCRIVRGWRVWVVGLVMTVAAWEAQGQFFAMPAGNNGDKKADWTVEELMEEADEWLDRQWNDRLKTNRARAMLYYDEIIRTCELTDSQKRKLRAAAKGMAHKMTWQWRQRIENQLVSRLEMYHQQGVNRAQARNLVTNYTQGRVVFGSSNDGDNAPQVFWNRAVATVLDAESRKKLKERQRRRQERLWKLQREWVLATLDQGLRLTDEQEAKLRKVLESGGGRAGMMAMGMVIADEDDPFQGPESGTWVVVQLFRSNPEARKILSKEQWEVIKASMRDIGWDQEELPDEAEEEAAEDTDGEERDAQAAETDEESSEKKETDTTETDKEISKEKSSGESDGEESGSGSSGGERS